MFAPIFAIYRYTVFIPAHEGAQFSARVVLVHDLDGEKLSYLPKDNRMGLLNPHLALKSNALQAFWRLSR